MTHNYEKYKKVMHELPAQSWAWNMYGAGVEQIGRDGKPEQVPVPEPGEEQLLVRIDSVGLCFSDVKLIRQGGNHPKLYNRDLAQQPTRLGHEVTLTVVKVGEKLRDRYHPGQRLSVQPDIYQEGKSTAYGYTVPGGLIQYHLIGAEVLETDEGACLLPLEGEMGYAEASLLEPWGCVVAAYTQRRRLEPKPGGIMWIIGKPGDTTDFQFSAGVEAPETIVLTDPPASLGLLAQQTSAEIVIRDGLRPAEYARLSEEMTAGSGFDDLVLLRPSSAAAVTEAARHLARRGTMNLVGTEPLDGLVSADVGRLHYDYLAFLGTRETDIAAAYGELRNRCELRPGGTAVFVGAGGPMGQMHVQRAIEKPDGPGVIIATEVNQPRLEALQQRFVPLAKKHDRQLVLFNPTQPGQSLHRLVMEKTGGRGADDVIISVPFASLMEEGAALMNEDGMLVLFAGVPNGTLVPLNLSNVYLHNAQYTGTSGLTIEDQRMVMRRALDGDLSPEWSVAAIGGMNAARAGIESMMESRYPGKIVIFPQIEDLPLLGLDELEKHLPSVAEHLGPGNEWTSAAEEALFDHYWRPAG